MRVFAAEFGAARNATGVAVDGGLRTVRMQCARAFIWASPMVLPVAVKHLDDVFASFEASMRLRSLPAVVNGRECRFRYCMFVPQRTEKTSVGSLRRVSVWTYRVHG
jgi:hypothetical protein